MARPRKAIDGEKVRQFASFGASAAEIAAELGVGERTIERRFGPILKQGAKMRDLRLRSAMFKYAVRGNAQLLIFLAKVCLGMREDPSTLISVVQNAGQPQLDLATMKQRMIQAEEFVEKFLEQEHRNEPQLLPGQTAPRRQLP